MTRELLGFGVAGLCVALAVVLTWIACNAWIPPRPRRWVRWAYPGLMLVLGGPLIFSCVSGCVSEGDVLCLDCGRSRHELTLFSIRIPMDRNTDERGVGAVSDEYEAAFPATVEREHPHAWIPVGCHESGVGMGGMICCTKIGACDWYRDLPKLADRQLAAALAARFARSDAHEKEGVIRSYDQAASDRASVDERFAVWRTAWRRDHSTWP